MRGGVRHRPLHSPIPPPRPRGEGATRRRPALKTGVFYAGRPSLGEKSPERVDGTSSPVDRPFR